MDTFDITPTDGGDKTPTMSSREIADLVEKRHDNVKRTIETLAEKGIIGLPQTEEYRDSLGRSASEYRVGKRDSFVIVAQLSPEFTARVVDRWQELENANSRPPMLTTAETLLNIVQIQVQQERVQAEHTRRIQNLDTKVDQIEKAQVVMSSCPANAESITKLRPRIRDMFGISFSTIDSVLRQSPYAPKPAGTVKNPHESAKDSTFAVYWKKDVTAVFDRFEAECMKVTPKRFSHPFVRGTFKMAGKQRKNTGVEAGR